MNQHLVNLTNDLINTGGYALMFRRSTLAEFTKYATLDLYSGAVRKMSPAKLGEIMCEFGIGDVLLNQEEIFNEVRFSGDCEDFLRQQVALCLGCIIRDRLDGTIDPKWEPPSKDTELNRIVSSMRRRGAARQ